jgi:hypothetical protein
MQKLQVNVLAITYYYEVMHKFVWKQLMSLSYGPTNLLISCVYS